MEQFNFGPAKVQVADELNSKVDKNQGSQHAGKVLGIGNDGAVTPVPFAGLDTKVDKNQGVQHAGKALGIGSDGMVTPVAFSGEDFTGATATTNGVHGYVPAPLAGEQAKVLTGDGTWQVSPGAKVYVKTITVTNTSGAYSQTFEDDNIVADMKAVELEVTRAYVFGDVITVTPSNGSITVACSDVSGTDTIKISLIKVISDPTAITSTEFDILNNRLLAVENIYTDTSITIAASSWVLSSGEYVYTWVSQNVTTACGIEVFLMDGAENAGIESFEYEKVTGGVKFTSTVQPIGSLPVTIRIINAKASDIETITADMVATDIITGAVNVEEALEILDEKPDYATEMPISSSDSTTVSETLTSQSQAIANLLDYTYIDITTKLDGSDKVTYPATAKELLCVSAIHGTDFTYAMNTYIPLDCAVTGTLYYGFWSSTNNGASGGVYLDKTNRTVYQRFRSYNGNSETDARMKVYYR